MWETVTVLGCKPLLDEALYEGGCLRKAFSFLRKACRFSTDQALPKVREASVPPCLCGDQVVEFTISYFSMITLSNPYCTETKNTPAVGI